MTQFDRVYPQGAVQPITALLRASLLDAGKLNSADLDVEPNLASIGTPIHVVFCKYASNVGGVFLSPPAARVTLSNTGFNATTRLGLVLSDGKLPTIAQADVWWGSKANVATIVQSYGSLPSGCTGTINVTAQTYTKTEVYTGATGSSGVPAERNDSTRAKGTGVLEVRSKGNTCKAFSASIDYANSSYMLKGEGNGLDGYPQFITGKNWGRTTTKPEGDPDDPRSYAVIAARKYTAMTTGMASYIIWSKTETKVNHPDKLGLAEYTVKFHTPYRNTSFIYPDNETFGSASGSNTDINTWLTHARDFASNNITTIDNASYSGTRDAKYIGSGSSLEVFQDNFAITVTEVTEYDYPKPSGYPSYGGSGGSFAGMSTLCVTYTGKIEDGQFYKQAHVFIRNGIEVTRLIEGTTGSSNLFPDLVRYFMQRTALVPDALIDTDRLRQAAEFTNAQGLYFNGVIAEAMNLRQWMDAVAPYFLLRITQVDGKYGLAPALPTNGTAISTDPVVPAHVFDNSNILAGSFQRESADASDLRPFCALMSWRQQSTSTHGTVQTTEVRYAGMAPDGPFEQYDMSSFCCTQAHAVKAGRYILSRRRHVTHYASWESTAEQAGTLNPGDIVRVSITSTDSKTGAEQQYSELYQLEQIEDAADGIVRLSAAVFPVDGLGRSLVALDMSSGTFSVE